MGDHPISAGEFEAAMESLFLSKFGNSTPDGFNDADFDKIGRFLMQVGKQSWSVRPRTYVVLRLIGQVHLLDEFVVDGLKDIAFPYQASRLPTALNTPTVRANFLQKQALVLTSAADLETSGGRHRHFAQDANVHFRTIKTLGRGGFGVVDHIRSKLSLEEYARKRVLRKKAFSKDKEAIKMFENELSNLTRLSHHHLVKFVGSYTDPRYIGLLMSPVADCDLKAFLERKPFPEDDLDLLRTFFGCLCAGLLYLHDNKCRHKDIKPGNILVHDGNVLITDFGTARDWSELSRSTTVGRPSAYTPAYAAPEVVNEEPRNSSSDIWSLGCVYLEMATVLRGETLEDKTAFFHDCGTGGLSPRTNPKALELWLEQKVSDVDREPLVWIRQMIKDIPRDRITAAMLLDQIHQCGGDRVYYGLCCDGEESDEESSYQGSIPEEYTMTANRKGISCTTPPVDPETDTVVPAAGQHSEKQPKEHGKAQSRRQNDQTATDSQATAYTGLGVERDAEYAKAIESLLRDGFDIDGDDFNADNALLVRAAAHDCNEIMVRILLEKGADVAAKNSYGFTALHWAARRGHENVVRLLLGKGADVAAKDRTGGTALHTAADNGHETVVRLLLEKGADVSAEDSDGRTALQCAAGNEALMWLLLDWADIAAKDSEGWMALHKAAMNGAEVEVRLLLEKGADVAAEDEEGWTALHWAAYIGHEAVVQLLLEKGADAAAKDRILWTVLHVAAWNGNEAVVRLLLEKGADVAAMNRDRRTALHLAAKKGQEAAAELLLENGANVVMKDKTETTALHSAAYSGHEAVVRLLLEKGADVAAKEKTGKTALHLAASNGHDAVVRLLLERGADVAAKDRTGGTALHTAADYGHETVVRLLLEKGAEVAAEDSDGRTALQCAAGNRALVRLLFNFLK